MASMLYSITVCLLIYMFETVIANGVPCVSGAYTNNCQCQEGYTPYVSDQDTEADQLCYPTCSYCFNVNCFHYTDNEIRCTACTNNHILIDRSCWKNFEFGNCNLKHEGDQIVPTCHDCNDGYQKIGNGCYRSLSRGMCFRYEDSYKREREHCVSCTNGWTMAYGDCICAGFGSSNKCLPAGTAVAISVIITLIICVGIAALIIYFKFVKKKKSHVPTATSPYMSKTESASLFTTHSSLI